MRRFVAWLMRRTNICAHRSPEGWICIRERWHSGLHRDAQDGGYAWGGD